MAENSRRVAVIATKGDLEGAYPPLNIATAAAAMGAEVAVFCTFGGLNILRKHPELHLPMPDHLKGAEEGFKRAGVPPVSELIEICKESGVKLIACQMTMDVMGITEDDLVDGLDYAGATSFLDFAFDADTTVTF